MSVLWKEDACTDVKGRRLLGPTLNRAHEIHHTFRFPLSLPFSIVPTFRHTTFRPKLGSDSELTSGIEDTAAAALRQHSPGGLEFAYIPRYLPPRYICSM